MGVIQSFFSGSSGLCIVMEHVFWSCCIILLLLLLLIELAWFGETFVLSYLR